MATISATNSDGSSLRRGKRNRGDAVFRGISLGSGIFVLVILAAIAGFLLAKGIPAIRSDTTNFFTTQQINASNPASGFGIAAIGLGTVVSSLIALIMSVPIALGVALFVTEYAPARVARILGYLSDLLAAVPSVIYGAWAALFLLPHMVGLQHFLATYFGWIPIFSDPSGQAAHSVSHSIFNAAVILGIMTLPIIAAISREVFRQVDPAQREGALALGATRWEMIRTSVLPQSRPGVISAIMLGLGRALGETIAVALVIGNAFFVFYDTHVLENGGGTIASNIANQFGEASPAGRDALIATGLMLFVLTLVVNLFARYVMARGGTREAAAV